LVIDNPYPKNLTQNIPFFIKNDMVFIDSLFYDPSAFIATPVFTRFILGEKHKLTATHST